MFNTLSGILMLTGYCVVSGNALIGLLGICVAGWQRLHAEDPVIVDRGQRLTDWSLLTLALSVLISLCVVVSLHSGHNLSDNEEAAAMAIASTLLLISAALALLGSGKGRVILLTAQTLLLLGGMAVFHWLWSQKDKPFFG
jgi:cytochrome bd-type quinol oxidase subunit 2